MVKLIACEIGVSAHGLLNFDRWIYSDPFLMLDHLGPAKYGPGEAVGAPDHPHRGFETVTYVLSGGFEHKDSAGNRGTLSPGWVQWMTAGSGVIHSEMPSAELLKNGGVMEGFQLWLNLPRSQKMVTPKDENKQTYDKHLKMMMTCRSSKSIE